MDCDHYFNNSKALREAMCFMMDPAYGKKTCYVQFPQRFDGIDLHDRYANRNIVFFDVRNLSNVVPHSMVYIILYMGWTVFLTISYFADQFERVRWHPGACLCGNWMLFQQAGFVWV